MTEPGSYHYYGSQCHPTVQNEYLPNHDCCLDFLRNVFMNDDQLDDQSLLIPTTIPLETEYNSIGLVSENHEDFTVDPLIFLMQEYHQPQKIACPLPVTAYEQQEYSSSYDPATAVTVSLADDEIVYDASESESEIFEDNSDVAPLLSRSFVSVSPVTLMPEVSYVPCDIQNLSTMHTYDSHIKRGSIPVDEDCHYVPTVQDFMPTMSVPSTMPATSYPLTPSSLLMEPSLQQQVDEAVREFKERQKRKFDLSTNVDSATQSRKSNAFEPAAPKRGNALEREACEVMKQFWKRRKTSSEISTVLPTPAIANTFKTENQFPYSQFNSVQEAGQNEPMNIPVPRSIVCPTTRTVRPSCSTSKKAATKASLQKNFESHAIHALVPGQSTTSQYLPNSEIFFPVSTYNLWE